ncbi:hypothetical protein BH10PSE2_BH10PSE2_15000 [soil metagenome]
MITTKTSGISPGSQGGSPEDDSGASPLLFSRFAFRRNAPTLKIETIMAVPKRKVSPSRRNMRRAHDALGVNAYTEDKDTGELRRSHHIDLKTGTYRGRQVLTPKED